MQHNWKYWQSMAAREVDAVVSALPPPLRARAERLPVTLPLRPNAALQADGIEADTLGLFIGMEFAQEGSEAAPSQIILFVENILDEAEGDERVFRDEIRKTFLHELGHYLGLDEKELEQRGLE